MKRERQPIAHWRTHVAPYALWLIVLVSVAPWRQGVFFDGGIDAVVLGKAATGVLALCLAWLQLSSTKTRQRVGARSIAILTFFVALSTVGAFAAGELTSALVLSVRVMLLAVTVLLIVGAFPPRVALQSLLGAMALLAIASSVSGIESLLAGERLTGALPLLHANQIAILCGLPLMGLAYQLVHEHARPWQVATTILLVGILLATGSRTSLVAFLVGFALVVLHAKRFKPSTIAMLALSIPAVFALFMFTDTFTQIIDRGEGAAKITTLNSRTIAWEAVLTTPNDTWERWIGAGLAIKEVPVVGQFWDEQVLDSSWISALAQAGIIGVAALAVWVLLTFWRSSRTPSLRSMTTPVLVFIGILSFLENGLIESSTMFIAFFVVSLLVEPASQAAADAQSTAERDDLVSGRTERREPQGVR